MIIPKITTMRPNTRIVASGLLLALLSGTPASNQVSAPAPILRPVPAFQQGLQYKVERNNETYTISVNNLKASFGNVKGDLRLDRLIIDTNGQRLVTEFVIGDVLLNRYSFTFFYEDLNLHLLNKYGKAISPNDAEALFRPAFNRYKTIDAIISQ